MRFILFGLVCAGLCGITVVAQQPQPPASEPPITFKTEVNYVDVDAVVTDQQGNFVKGLTKDDFEILEDGKPQKLEMFSFVDLPVRDPHRQDDGFFVGGRRIAADVRTNEQSLAGRLYVIVLDDLDTSTFRAGTVKRTAHEFIERHLSPGDVAAVVYTSGRGDASQDFTSDPVLLNAAVDKFVGRKLRSYTLDKIDTFFNIKEQQVMSASGQDPNAPAPKTNSGSESSGSSTDPTINPNTRGDGYPDKTFDSEDLERGWRAQGVLNELRQMADYLGAIHGRRKAMVLFSEGIDYPTDDIFGAQDATIVIKAMQDAIAAAARGNVSIFGIDPRGLVGMSSEVAGELDSMGTVDDPLQANAYLTGFKSEMQLSQDSLKSLSEETGGFASVSANDPSSFFDRLVRANSTYYMLGYYPPTHARDGRFHKIEVRMKRPDLKVSARKGYADPRGKTPEEREKDDQERLARDAKKGGADTTSADLRDVLNSPMQQAGVTMLVQAAPFRTSAKEQSVAMTIELDGSRFHFEPQKNGTVYADNVELSYFSMNEFGKPLHGERRVLELSLKPDTYQRARQVGVRINQRLALAPGRYQLRIGVREAGTASLGTLFYDLQVPDFSKATLSMSGLLLTASTSPIVPTLIADAQVDAASLPGPATSRRTFGQGDELALYAEIYSSIPANQNQTVGITTSLIGEDGTKRFESRETWQGGAQPNVSSSTFGFSKRVPLTDVAPGRYLLRIEAQASGSVKDAKTASTETLITVIRDSK